jgi:hypothetical protein
MFALCRENGVKIFGKCEQIISHDEFLGIPVHYEIILDLANVHFSLEKLSNCNLLDAYRVLHCEMEILSNFESAFLVRKDVFHIFQKTDHYIQKNCIKNQNVFSKLKIVDGVFLIENVIAEFCRSVFNINEENWWLYVAPHDSSTRIVAGIGSGVILSRFLTDTSDPSDEVLKTITYLKRFGLKETIKIVTPLKKIESHLQQNQVCEICKLERCDDFTLMEFLSKTSNARKIFARRNYFTRINEQKIYAVAYTVAFFLLILCAGLYVGIAQEKEKILTLQKSMVISNNNISLTTNYDNFSLINQFVMILKEDRNPINTLVLIQNICRKHNVTTESVVIENGNFIKIKTFLDKIQLKEIGKANNDNFEIKIEKLAAFEDGYEELGVDKKFGAVICIKIK